MRKIGLLENTKNRNIFGKCTVLTILHKKCYNIINLLKKIPFDILRITGRNKKLEELNMENYANTTFLGGTCNNSTWRQELISQLSENVDFFNPVVDDWTPECQAREDHAREEAKYVLFVITSQLTGVFSIAEVVDCSNKRPESTLFCVILDGFDKAQAKSLKAVSKMVERNGAKVFDTVEEIAVFLNSAYK